MVDWQAERQAGTVPRYVIVSLFMMFCADNEQAIMWSWTEGRRWNRSMDNVMVSCRAANLSQKSLITELVKTIDMLWLREELVKVK